MTTTIVSGGRRLLALARRLGAQAVLSATVMAGLHIASVNGFDLRELLPDAAPRPDDAAPAPALPLRYSGVPARYDLPVQAGGLLESLVPRAPAETALRETAGPDRPSGGDGPAARQAGQAPEPAGPADRAPVSPTIAQTLRVAVPTPRPVQTADRILARPPTIVPAAPSRASARDLPFDTSRPLGTGGPLGDPRSVAPSPGPRANYDVAELVGPDPVPVPILAEEPVRVGGIVPSGTALLQRTARATGTAAEAVTDTALRLIDLVR